MMFLPWLVRAENRAENSFERMLAVWTIISLACTQHGEIRVQLTIRGNSFHFLKWKSIM